MEDLDSYHHIMKQKEVYQWLGKAEEKNKDQVKKIIEYDLNHWKEHNLGTFAIILNDNNKLIGHCGINYVKDIEEFELLYALDQRYWGKGYATEACKAVIEWVKQNKKLNQLVALAYQNNERSIHVIKKLNFNYIKPITLFGADLYLYQVNFSHTSN